MLPCREQGVIRRTRDELHRRITLSQHGALPQLLHDSALAQRRGATNTRPMRVTRRRRGLRILLPSSTSVSSLRPGVRWVAEPLGLGSEETLAALQKSSNPCPPPVPAFTRPCQHTLKISIRNIPERSCEHRRAASHAWRRARTLRACLFCWRPALAAAGGHLDALGDHRAAERAHARVGREGHGLHSICVSPT